ncbi:MAG: ROK family transcriptional regulator [Clostridia bacterium]|nr:ROK family transcriptional regulator [Clostridia bacterium]
MSKTTPLSTIELRRQNRNRVYLRLVTSDAPVTKQDLAQELSMSLPTLTQNLKELLAMGLIDDSETTDSTGGRKPRLIGAVSSARFAVGAELSRGHIRLAAVDLKQELMAFEEICRPFRNDEGYAQTLAHSLETFLDAKGLDRSRLLGVGLTLPGIINSAQDTIEYAPTIGLHKMSKNEISRFIPYPTYLDNDASCGGFAEWWNHSGEGNMAYLSLSHGVGGAIMIDGALYPGSSHRSAEFGHICLHPEGRLCNCGKRGCLEACCSAARLSGDLDITLDQFFGGLEAGNSAYRKIWDVYLEDLSMALNTIHSILDCEVVLGGSVSQYLSPYQSRLEEMLTGLNFFPEGGNYIHICRYHGRSVSVGAAMHFTTKFVEEL